MVAWRLAGYKSVPLGERLAVAKPFDRRVAARVFHASARGVGFIACATDGGSKAVSWGFRPRCNASYPAHLPAEVHTALVVHHPDKFRLEQPTVRKG